MQSNGCRRRVLISAYACQPHEGSEPGVGWNWVQQISRFHDVWVITRANNKHSIEQELQRNPLPNVRWIFYDLPRFILFWKKKVLGVHLYYYLWQMGAFFICRRKHKILEFALAHHITFGTYWLPSFLAFLPIPFIWGPVGGAESSPPQLIRGLGLAGRAYEIVRGSLRWIGENDPLVRATIRNAMFGLAKAAETHKRLVALGAKRVECFGESAMSAEEQYAFANLGRSTANPVRFLSIGRLIHWKGFHLSLEAFASLLKEIDSCEYWIVGDGPEKHRIESAILRLELRNKLRLLGSLPRKEVFSRLAECDVLLHPSLHDSGGWVCLEAMAAGRPVVCLDIGGPATQVTGETGFKISVHSQEQVIRDLKNAMLRLAIDPDLRQTMGTAARERVRAHFSWDAKGDAILRLYSRILQVKAGISDRESVLS